MMSTYDCFNRAHASVGLRQLASVNFERALPGQRLITEGTDKRKSAKSVHKFCMHSLLGYGARRHLVSRLFIVVALSLPAINGKRTRQLGISSKRQPVSRRHAADSLQERQVLRVWHAGSCSWLI